MDIALNSQGDLDLTGNELHLLSGTDAIEQHWRIRLKSFAGDWLLDQRNGIPYYEQVLVKNPNMAVLRAIFHEASLGTPGIAEITLFTMDLSSDRVLSITIEGLSEDLEKFRFEYEDLVLPEQQEQEV